MRKVCVPILNRAHYGRLKALLNAINNHPILKLQLIVGASAVTDRKVINTILADGFKVDAEVYGLVDGDEPECMANTTGLLTVQLTTLFKQLKPQIVFCHADRYEQIAVAIAASYTNTHLAHAEGGDLSGTIDGKVRHSISHLADLHFPISRKSGERLAQMGIAPDRIHVVGSTALDLLNSIDLTNTRTDPYSLILCHPNTTSPENIQPLIEAVKQLNMHVIWTNPNVDAGSKAMLKQIHRQKVEFVKNLPPEEYARLLYNCQCAIGNSSSFIKEGAFLSVPAVLVGARQEGREHGDNVIFVDYDTKAILGAVRAQMGRKYPPDYRFGDGTASKKIANILATVKVREKKLCLVR